MLLEYNREGFFDDDIDATCTDEWERYDEERVNLDTPEAKHARSG